MMKPRLNAWTALLSATLAVLSSPARVTAAPEAGVPPDPYGIIRQPIPAKVVVLTFDDGCASHATFVAPLLKQYGFGGTFYVSEAFGFRTRKDWYLTWDQIQELAAQGFEVGNHTVGHGQLSATGLDGCRSAVEGIERECQAHGVARPVTFCWPFYSVNNPFIAELAGRGYLFARGGGERPYVPTQDCPFDAPSFTIHDGALQKPDSFAAAAQQATPGRIVIFTFHGVPDGEHPAVGTDPARFAELMQYLKDNHYSVLALRDLARYVDPAKAALLLSYPHRLPWGDRSPPWGGVTRQDNRLYLCVTKMPADRRLTLPNMTTRIKAAYFLADRRQPPLTVVCADNGLQTIQVPEYPAAAYGKSPVVIVAELQGGPRPTLLDFIFPGLPAAVMAGDEIRVAVPLAADVTKLAPVYRTGAPEVTGQPASGSTQDFSRPQTYLITAPDGATRKYRVTVTRARGAVGVSNPSFERYDRLSEFDDTLGRNPGGALWTFQQKKRGDEVGICHLAGPITAPPAPDGTRHAAFIRGPGNRIAQAVTFDEGRYTVRFDLVKRRGYSPRSTPLAVTLDGAPVLALEPEQISDQWQRYTSPPFTATAGVHTLAFVLGAGDGMDLVDAVSVNPAAK